MGLPLYEGVDWNPEVDHLRKRLLCLPLYEGVDWNWIRNWRSPNEEPVSLFTREWIEMSNWYVDMVDTLRLPLYEGVDWNRNEIKAATSRGGLPLYEGVDWNGIVSGWLKNSFVSLFTREWIEIAAEYTALQEQLSPSLRGSGLKLSANQHLSNQVLSPSLRGSGLKFGLLLRLRMPDSSPSLRGSGLKSPPPGCVVACRLVSLFTREWIEMCFGLVWWARRGGLPLYEGVDWNGAL